MPTGDMVARALVYSLINRERDAQDRKWKRQNGEWTTEDFKKLGILVEEVGEVAQALLEDDDLNATRELIQVACVAVAWLESEGVEWLKYISDFDADDYGPDPELKVLREVYAAAADLRGQIADHGPDGVTWMYAPHVGGEAIDKLDDALDKYDLLERRVKE